MSALGMNLRRQMGEPLSRTSLSLIGSTVVTAVLGVAFWTAAAHLQPVRIVGRESALIVIMMALANISQVNLPNVIVRFMPQVHAGVGRRIAQAYAIAAGCGVVAAGLFVVIAPRVSTRFAFLGHDLGIAVLFVLGLVAWTVFCLQDSVLTALGRAPWLPIENGSFSAAKLALLPLAVWAGATHALFIAWVVPMFATVAIINYLIVTRVVPARARTSEPSLVIGSARWGFMRFVTQDFAGTALALAGATAMPLIVLQVLGPQANGYFYVPFTLILTFDLMFQAVATSLTTEAARDPARVKEFAAATLRQLVRLQVPAALLVCVAAPWCLALFGSGYVEHSTTLLRLLAIASCGRAVVALFLATARLAGRGLLLLWLPAVGVVAMVVGALVLAPGLGIDGVGLSWMVTWLGLAILAMPSLIRYVRTPLVTTLWQVEAERLP